LLYFEEIELVFKEEKAANAYLSATPAKLSKQATVLFELK
jgi:hypothetical protein